LQSAASRATAAIACPGQSEFNRSAQRCRGRLTSLPLFSQENQLGIGSIPEVEFMPREAARRKCVRRHLAALQNCRSETGLALIRVWLQHHVSRAALIGANLVSSVFRMSGSPAIDRSGKQVN
jgi:hypothetical protein